MRQKLTRECFHVISDACEDAACFPGLCYDDNNICICNDRDVPLGSSAGTCNGKLKSVISF